MSNIYDQQFRERVLRHRTFTDETSADLLSQLVQFADSQATEIADLKQKLAHQEGRTTQEYRICELVRDDLAKALKRAEESSAQLKAASSMVGKLAKLLLRIQEWTAKFPLRGPSSDTDKSAADELYLEVTNLLSDLKAGQ